MFLADLYSLLTLVLAGISILLLLRFYGKSGLYVYSIITIIAANIQVLKLTKYTFWPEPMPLGTVLFSTMFAVDNILNEYFGVSAAKKCVYLGFVGYLIFSLFMTLADWHPILDSIDTANYAHEIHKLFSPSFSFFVASLAAYFVGQFCDIYIYSYLKQKIHNITVKSALTMCVATFVDNFVFSILAWKILAVVDIPLRIVLNTYVINTSIFRLILVALCLVIISAAKSFMSSRSNNCG